MSIQNEIDKMLISGMLETMKVDELPDANKPLYDLWVISAKSIFDVSEPNESQVKASAMFSAEDAKLLKGLI